MSFMTFQHTLFTGRKQQQQQQQNSTDKDNMFCTVGLGPKYVKVIICVPKSNTVQRLCSESGYECTLANTLNDVTNLLKDLWHQTIIIVSADGDLTYLKEYIIENCMSDVVTLLGILPSNVARSATLFARLREAGVTRFLLEEECEWRLVLELQMIEEAELRLKHALNFCHALYEAVEQSNDAIQITGENSTILYVNRAFVDLSGYSRDEAIGKPATDILKCFGDNGQGAFLKRDHDYARHYANQDGGMSPSSPISQQKWDGECLGRRKSGSYLKQHLKLIPVKVCPASRVVHHVTIQRLLASHDSNAADGLMHTNLKKPPLSNAVQKMPPLMETPITKVVQTLMSARDRPDCTVDVKDALERAMEILRSSELYAPIGRTDMGIVAGLLQGGRRNSVSAPSEMRVFPSHHHRHTIAHPIVPPLEILEALGSSSQWDFDIVKLESISNHEPLYYLGMQIFKKFEMCDVLNIDEDVLAQWLKLMESHYHRSNAYHNSTHAADVLQATTYLINLLQDYLVSQGDMLEPMEIASLLITAVIHDLDHPGRTNPFLCNSADEMAILYNDTAVLENHHVALSFKLTSENKAVNIYQSLDASTFRSLRGAIIDLVLATDMAKHFEHLAKFKNSIAAVEETGSSTSLTSKENRESRMLMKRILVKCADISNPCRQRRLCKIWAQRIANEYFAQTAEEKEHNLPIVFPDFDEQTCNIPATQIKFIDFFITELFGEWHNFSNIPELIAQLQDNYQYWLEQYSPPPTSENEATDHNQH
ncbi:hypothetical protein EMCRGX_G021720 [Ephydatia muelleri]